MFLLTVEWFGLPDTSRSTRSSSSTASRASSNDQLRQTWMSTAVPLCEELGLDVPAHYDDASQKWVLDCAFPATLRRGEQALAAGGRPDDWDEVMKRWKRRGPKNVEFVDLVQRGNKGLAQLLGEEVA